ncbi:hypothetical protein A5844_000568 [Enterococcus sp. 10A9_DIV0425]|uniref:Peptidase S54 rhomboid domain-containing protein n=1 Tax=Candidatus Enterococcus wittei TaxID=1987383 RepID=A0A2C9XSF3_9ENTE|nr:hypothetical protein A5844_000568 [Enterococcus sp. 10A9_DIV0425]
MTYLFLGIQTIVFIGIELFPFLDIPKHMGMYGPFIVIYNEWWRLITPIFIHFGLVHFIMNSLILYFMGEQIETLYGHTRFFFIYLLSGVMGNLVSFAFNDAGVLSGGASTSLFGLFGALFILGFHYKNDYLVTQTVRRYVTFIALSFFFSLMDPSVDIWGHVGGIIGGFLIGNIVGLPKRFNDYSIHQRILSVIIFVFLLIICVLLGLKNYGLLV